MVEALGQGVTDRVIEAPGGEADVGVGEQEPVAFGLPRALVERVVLAQPSFGELLDPDPLKTSGRSDASLARIWRVRSVERSSRATTSSRPW